LILKEKHKAEQTMTDCSICFTDITEETGRTVLGCKHEFHLKCVVTWLQKGGSCPCCRQSPGEMEDIAIPSQEDEESDDWTDDPNATPLMKAVRDNNLVEIRRLVHEEAVDIEAVDSDGDTALTYTAIFRSMEAADLLLSLGANILVLGRLGLSSGLADTIEPSLDLALLGSCYYNFLPAIRACLDRGADPNAQLSGVSTTPLMELVRSETNSCVEAARLLLERGAKVYATDGEGWTVFDWMEDEGIEEPALIELLNGCPQVVAARRIQDTWRLRQITLCAATLTAMRFTVTSVFQENSEEEKEEPSWFMSRMMLVQ
jgi:hypothetical protein